MGGLSVRYPMQASRNLPALKLAFASLMAGSSALATASRSALSVMLVRIASAIAMKCLLVMFDTSVVAVSMAAGQVSLPAGGGWSPTPRHPRPPYIRLVNMAGSFAICKLLDGDFGPSIPFVIYLL